MKNISLVAVLAMLAPVFAGAQSTNPSNVYRLGNGAATNKSIIFNRGSNNPSFRWNEATSKVQVSSDGSTFQDLPGASPDQSYELTNLALSTSVASSALTIALKTKAGTDATSSDAVKVGYRNVTLTTGTYTQVTTTAALSVVVSSGSTLGQVSATAEPIYVYAINNAGATELAVSTSYFDQAGVISTTAEGGAGAADSRVIMYSTTARTNVPFRFIGRLITTQTTAGTWAANSTAVAPTPADGKPIIVENTGPIIAKKQASTNTAYLLKNDRTQSYPLVVSADPSGANGLMIVRGSVNTGSTTPNFGEGFSLSGASTGQVNVNYTTAFSAEPTCTCTAASATICTLGGSSTSTATIVTIVPATSTQTNATAHFICIGPRP